tara:strand:+ start:59 stop:547 length:489 start_codon:yes stop_codon:yes gene_type:complete
MITDLDVEGVSSFLKSFPDHKIVATNGCFDILHAGHVAYLEAAKELGDVLIVGLNDDDSIKELKGSTRPINCLEDRARVLASVRYVDLVVIFHEKRAHEFIKAVQPDIYVKGGDYTLDSLSECERLLLEENTLDIVILPQLTGRSTTNIVNKLINMKTLPVK